MSEFVYTSEPQTRDLVKLLLWKWTYEKTSLWTVMEQETGGGCVETSSHEW